jgi:hypothetical protein
MTNEYLPFGGPSVKRSRNTRRRITWTNYSFAYENVWHLFSEHRKVVLGPGPRSEMLKIRQRFYEHRYLVSEAAALGDTKAQELMILVRDAYTQFVDCPNGQVELHIVPDPAIAYVNEALEKAGAWTQPPLTQAELDEQAKKEMIEEIRKQLDKTEL